MTQARDSRQHVFRISVIAGSVVPAIAGSVVLATRDSGETVTTRGVTATLRVPGHPGSIAADSDTLWVVLSGDPRRPVGDEPLLRLALATGAVAKLGITAAAEDNRRVPRRAQLPEARAR